MTTASQDNTDKTSTPRSLSSLFPEGGDDPDFFLPAKSEKELSLVCRLPGVRGVVPWCK